MKPKHKVGIGVRKEASFSWVPHNKAVHPSHPRDHSSRWGPWARLSWALLEGGSWLQPPLADKGIIPRVWAQGVHRALHWAPFPLAAQYHPAKTDPKT